VGNNKRGSRIYIISRKCCYREAGVFVKKAIAIIASVVLGILAFIFGRKTTGKRKDSPSPPENKAANVAEDAVQESFEEQVNRIKSATTSDSPADDLADLGNARRR
jgi:hypothetical protein